MIQFICHNSKKITIKKIEIQFNQSLINQETFFFWWMKKVRMFLLFVINQDSTLFVDKRNLMKFSILMKTTKVNEKKIWKNNFKYKIFFI